LTVHTQGDSDAVHFTEKRGERGVCTFVLSSLATVTSCIYLSVRIVTKSPKVGPLLIFSISLDRLEPDGAALARSGAELELEWAPVHLQLASLPKYYLMLSKVRTSQTIGLSLLFRTIKRSLF
jgi:hypothetical protein